MYTNIYDYKKMYVYIKNMYMHLRVYMYCRIWLYIPINIVYMHARYINCTAAQGASVFYSLLAQLRCSTTLIPRGEL